MKSRCHSELDVVGLYFLLFVVARYCFFEYWIVNGALLDRHSALPNIFPYADPQHDMKMRNM